MRNIKELDTNTVYFMIECLIVAVNVLHLVKQTTVAFEGDGHSKAKHLSKINEGISLGLLCASVYAANEMSKEQAGISHNSTFLEKTIVLLNISLSTTSAYILTPQIARVCSPLIFRNTANHSDSLESDRSSNVTPPTSPREEHQQEGWNPAFEETDSGSDNSSKTDSTTPRARVRRF